MDEDIDQFGRSYKEQNNTHVSEQKKQSEKINIEKSIESLNVSVALAITLYEINRT